MLYPGSYFNIIETNYDKSPSFNVGEYDPIILFLFGYIVTKLRSATFCFISFSYLNVAKFIDVPSVLYFPYIQLLNKNNFSSYKSYSIKISFVIVPALSENTQFSIVIFYIAK
jgi:hypothetical protein